MALRTFSRLLTALAVAFLASVCVWSTIHAPAPLARTALATHWCPAIFPGPRVMDAAIREALRSDGDPPVNYFDEYLESEDFPPEMASLALRDYIRRKFEGRRIDVVIANATPALQFALRHREV